MSLLGPEIKAPIPSPVASLAVAGFFRDEDHAVDVRVIILHEDARSQSRPWLCLELSPVDNPFRHSSPAGKPICTTWIHDAQMRQVVGAALLLSHADLMNPCRLILSGCGMILEEQ
jgi:hypothetical protein